jgi:hypothetical protein
MEEAVRVKSKSRSGAIALRQGWGRWLWRVGGSSLVAIALFSHPTLAWATTWVPVADLGQQQQFVDVESIQPLGQGHVQARSYYVDQRSGTPQRTTYLTEYDCQVRRFRDVDYDGPVGQATWQPVDPDPLNTAAMEYACGQAQISLGSEDLPGQD